MQFRLKVFLKPIRFVLCVGTATSIISPREVFV